MRAKKDGSSFHFFYRIMNAYSSGQRKRRRIQEQENMTSKSRLRWHKTGKTKPVIENGVQKGFKKIMVLYAASRSGSKPDKRHWVMHQYHLGAHEDETEGEFVVSKIFYQPQKENDRDETCLVVEGCDMGTGQVIPKTPSTNAHDPPRPETTPPSDYVPDDYFVKSFVQEEYPKESFHRRLFDSREDFEAVDLSRPDFLLCNEIINSYITLDDLKPSNTFSTQVSGDYTSGVLHPRYDNASCGMSDLNNLELGTPPDFNDLQFPSQDSVFDLLDRF
ncbi:hypothetical protein OROGR_023491 [Orobanche gracilis]